MLRAVLDTNVLISALMSKQTSPPFEIYHAFTHQAFIHVTSVAILAEVEEVLNRPPLARFHRLTPQQCQTFLTNLALTSYVVAGKIHIPQVVIDPDDNKFLACADEGQAHFLVSGDKHLLDLKQYHSTQIVTPNEFLSHCTNVLY